MFESKPGSGTLCVPQARGNVAMQLETLTRTDLAGSKGPLQWLFAQTKGKSNQTYLKIRYMMSYIIYIYIYVTCWFCLPLALGQRLLVKSMLKTNSSRCVQQASLLLPTKSIYIHDTCVFIHITSCYCIITIQLTIIHYYFLYNIFNIYTV